MDDIPNKVKDMLGILVEVHLHEKQGADYINFNVSKRTATNDLQSLTQKELIEKIGTTGKGTSYVLRGNKGAKRAIKG